ncbi:MAG: ABC transporter ATP-binding protein [Actinomycetota bacterium]
MGAEQTRSRPDPAVGPGAGAADSSDAEGALSLRGVSKRYGRLTVLDQVSLEIAPGEQRAIIGPNGAGKTTLFNVIAGDTSASEGTVAFDSHDITRLPGHRRARRGISRTFQITTLFPELTSLENVLLALQVGTRRRFAPSSSWGDELLERARDLLRRIDLDSKTGSTVAELSHGEQRQIEICVASARRPRLLLLDEPAAGLAQADLPLITETLSELCAGVTLMLIEHDMSLVFGVAEKVTVLHHGRVVADGSVDEVRADPKVQEVYLGNLA